MNAAGHVSTDMLYIVTTGFKVGSLADAIATTDQDKPVEPDFK